MESGSALEGKRILLGISAGIAVYKCAELTRLFVKQGAEVQVVMTSGAQAFVSPLTFQALSGRAVRDTLLDPAAEQGMGHIELARWADLIVVAPATADIIARIHAGLANDLLTTLILASAAPVAIVPAMNQQMWSNSITQRNIAQLERVDSRMMVWGPAAGEQACGDVGEGRMLEPEMILASVQRFFQGSFARHTLNDDDAHEQAGVASVREAGSDASALLRSLRITITAGPTRERIDPVRYISNDSSGKMGYALAAAAANAGATVTLVSGPVNLPVPEKVSCISVESAEEMMAEADRAVASGCDIFIACAAVADYRSADTSGHKIKKDRSEELVLRLVKNPDILATIASRQPAPFCVGFAAETQNVLSYAREKLLKKKIDLIIANDVSVPGIGFNSDENAVTVVTRSGEEMLPQQSKQALAKSLLVRVAQAYRQVACEEQG